MLVYRKSLNSKSSVYWLIRPQTIYSISAERKARSNCFHTILHRLKNFKRTHYDGVFFK